MSIEQYLAPVTGRRSNICFDCAYPIAKCRWLHEGEPVPGWTAKKVLLQGNQTYHITACPLFKPDPLGRTGNTTS